ncbi:MAG: hypothetical protein AB8B96_08780 [Lysobacterales bacterium]
MTTLPVNFQVSARIRQLALLIACAVTLSACTTQTVKTVNSVPIDKADQELSQEQLLDVGLQIFDPGIPADQKDQDDDNIYPAVRRAEARYVPYLLKTTLEESNQWGAVRVLPGNDPSSEVTVTGEIRHSDGVVLEVRVTVTDATGRQWLDKKYADLATQFAYRDDVDYQGDAFQDLYNLVANDIRKARDELSREELTQIRTVANLRYAAEVAPDAFGEHLSEDKNGDVVINRLPAYDDPMMRRVNRIRESEFLFIDTVDQQYAVFYQQMDPSYDQWRRYSYEETLAEEDIKRSARTRALAGLLGVVGGAAISSSANGNWAQNSIGNAAALGGLYALKQSYDTYQEAKIHQEALKELAASFDAEVKPIVLEVEGEVVKLNGSLDAQYKEWRRLMREIYETETGIPVADAVPQ